ncbi:hypothetical protein [Kribbella sp. NBC_00889]|uniref:hypothetical protein n=1 Tax=Kribbella sp. NBC_00889 TaxID=2975974 RepID=UPI00386C6348|nr:hypothetical protein OG817_22095 [Kribbella sp. NBC_00889]
MGASLVAAATVNVLPHLGRNHAARVALLIMANTAKDNDAEPWYQAGWRPIASALGLSGSEATQRDRVTKVLGQLEDIHAIRIVQAKAPGRQVKYGLDFWRPLRLIHSVDNPPHRDPGTVDNSHRATR